MATAPHHVVIVGGGFGGLRCAQRLGGSGARVTLLDRRNFHLFQPLLYQVATGALSPANIAAPLRSVLKRHRNVEVLLGEVVGLDASSRTLALSDGNRLGFDTLVLATGSRHHYFGHPEWEALAPGLKTVEDATEIRRRIFMAFEAAEREADPIERAALLTFIVVGGGPTGVELAGSLAEIAHHTMDGEFRAIDPAHARIVLIEGGPRLLPPYAEDSSAYAAKGLARIGVEVLASATVTDVRRDGVTVSIAGASSDIRARTVLWGAGVQASPLGKVVAGATGATLDRAGRVQVGADCSVPGHPSIFVIGDLAGLSIAWGSVDTPRLLPGVAQVAMQQGAYVAKLVRARIDARSPTAPFRYRDLGTMATIGRHLAVAEIGSRRLHGTIAWLAWLFIHVLKLVNFESRMLVMVQWFWSYITWNRSARLITGERSSVVDPAARMTPPGAPAP